jgi:hypothetical protein
VVVAQALSGQMPFGIQRAALAALAVAVLLLAQQLPTRAAEAARAGITALLRVALAAAAAAAQVLIAVHLELMGLQTRAAAAVAATALEVRVGPVWSFYPSQLPATQV